MRMTKSDLRHAAQTVYEAIATLGEVRVRVNDEAANYENAYINDADGHIGQALASLHDAWEALQDERIERAFTHSTEDA